MNYLNDQRISDDLWIYSFDIKSELTALELEVASLRTQLLVKEAEVEQLTVQIAQLQAALDECNSTTTSTSTSSTSTSTSTTSTSTTKPVTTSTSTTKAVPPTVATYFDNDFEGVTLSPKSNNTGMNINNWGLNELEECSSSLNFISGNVTSSILAAIVKDPKGSGRSVLQGTVLDDDPNWSGTSRFQLDVSLSEALREQGFIHMSHRMLLHPDLAYMSNLPGFNSSWFTLIEYWFEGGGDSNPAGNGRITVYVKEPVDGKLSLRAEMQRTPSGSQILLWREDAIFYNIPFDKWATWDYTYKRGEGTDGQFKLVITVDGEAPTTVFDIRKTTFLTDAPTKRCGYIAPFKLYCGDGPVMDAMRAAGRKIQACYNDFKWFKA